MNLESIISSANIRQYLDYLKIKGVPPATIERKLASIRRFTAWAQPAALRSRSNLEVKIQPSTPGWNLETPRGALAGLYSAYTNSRFSSYLHLAILVLFSAALAVFGYNQIFKEAPLSQAYPQAPSPKTPNRYLSFQARLTDSSDNPITVPTDFRFIIYNHETASASAKLWEELRYVDPDQDGIFSVNLGTETAIASSVFTENVNLWLGVTVETDAEATPRQRIATVGYALNAETLQGFPPSASASADQIPVLTQEGDLVMAAANPMVYSSSGTFAITGQALTITTAAGTNGDIQIAPDGTGNLDINLSSTAQNSVAITNSALTSGHLISGYVGNDTATGDLLNLSSGAVQAEVFTVDRTGGTYIAGTLDANGLFTLGDSGDTGAIDTSDWDINTTGDMTGIGAITADGSLTLSGTSANILLGSNYLSGDGGDEGISVDSSGNVTFTGTTTLNSIAYTWPGSQSSGYVLQTNGSGTLSWADVDASVSDVIYWSQSLGALYPKNSTVDLLVGGQATASAKFAVLNVNTGTPTASVSGSVAGYATYLTGDGTLSTANNRSLLLNPTGGNVGIGTTGPLSNLHIGAQNAVLTLGTGNSTSYAAGDILGKINFYNADPSGGGPNVVASIRSEAVTVGSGGDGNLIFGTNNQTEEGSSPLDRMVITNTGNVGIGTTAPGYNLDVQGAQPVINLTATTGTNYLYSRYSNTSGTLYLGIDRSIGGGLVTGSSAYAGIVAKSGNYPLQLATNNAVRVTVDGSGNVGIGTTAPDAKLDSLATTEQLRLTYTDGSVYSSHTVDSSGNLTIDNTGTKTIIADDLQINGGDILDSNGNESIRFGTTASAVNEATLTNAATAGTVLFAATGGDTDIALSIDSKGADALNLNGTATGDILLGGGAGSTGCTIANATGTLTCTVGVTAGALKWNALTVPDGNLTLAMDADTTTFNWDTLTSGTGLTLAANTTGAAGNTQKVLSLSTAGANAASTQTTYGLYATNTHTGTASTNVGGYFSTSGGTNNYAAIFENGNVGIGDTTPAALFTVGSGDLFQVDTSGNISIDNQADIRFYEGDAGGSNYTGFQAPATLAGDVLYTLPSADAAVSGYILSSNASGTLAWVSAAGAAASAIPWIEGAGILYPKNSTVDLLVGGQATTSAKFAVLNMNSGTPTASISGSVAGYATYLTGDGTLATTNRNSLTIGNSSTYNTTGNVLINSNGTGNAFIGDTSNANSTFGLTINQGANDDEILALKSSDVAHGQTDYAEADTFGLFKKETGSTGGLLIKGFKDVAGANVSALALEGYLSDTSGSTGRTVDSQGVITLSGFVSNGTTGRAGLGSDENLLVIRNGATARIVFDSEGTFHQVLNSDADVDILTVEVTGTPTLSWNETSDIFSLNKGLNVTGGLTVTGTTTFNSLAYTWPASQTAGYVLQTNGSGALSWANPLSGPASGWWRQVTGAISPINDTLDLLIGNTATTSAKFGFLNVNSGTPTASISANSGNIATYLTGDGTLTTTNRNSLTIGNSSTYDTTGNVLINPNGTGNVAIGTTSPSSYKLNVNGTALFSDAVTIQKANNISLAVDGNVNGAYSGIKINSNTSPWYIATQNNIFGGALNFNISGYTNTPLFSLSRTGDASTSASLVFTSATPTIDILNNADLTFQSSIGGDAGLAAKMTLTNSGNLGIGDTTPASLLTVGNGDLFQVDSSANVSLDNQADLRLLEGDAGGSNYTGFQAPATLAGDVLYTLPSADAGVSGYVLSSNASGTLSWVAQTGGGGGSLWRITTGALSTVNDTLDVLIGNTATTSAKFGFLNVNSGTPTATISANSGNNATFLTGLGNLGTTNGQTLTLGGATSGDILLQPNADTGDYFRFLSDGTNLTLATTDASDLTLDADGGGIKIGTGTPLVLDMAGDDLFITDDLEILGGVATMSAATNSITGKALNIQSTEFSTLNLGGSTTGNILLNPASNHFTIVQNNAGGAAALQIDQLGTGDVMAASVSGTTVFRIDTNGYAHYQRYADLASSAYYLDPAATGVSLIVAGDVTLEGGDILGANGATIDLGEATPGDITLTGDAIFSGTTTLNSLTYTWPGSQTAGYIMQTNGSGTLSWTDPLSKGWWRESAGALSPINDTLDILFGNTASASAKFAFLNVNSGTPTASISGSVAGYGVYLTGDGTLSTTLNRSLLLNPAGGNVGIGITSPGGKLDVKSTQTSGTLILGGAPSAVTLVGALTGLNIDLSTNYTATGFGVTGQSISLPAVTNTGAGTYAYKGLTVTGGALVQNTGAGTDTWTGLDITMPNITQTTGTVTSTGLKITGGTVTSGTSYALTTDANAGNVGIGITDPATKLDIDTGSNSLGLRLRGLAETVEISDIYIGAAGQLIFDNTAGTDTTAYIDFRSEDNLYGYIFRDSSGVATTPYLNIYVYDSSGGGPPSYTNFVMSAPTSTTGLVLTSDQYVGIGTTTPGDPLEVNGTIVSKNSVRGALNLYTSDTTIVDTQIMGLINFTGYDNSVEVVSAYIRSLAVGDWTATNTGTRLLFYTTASGSTTPVLNFQVGSDGTLYGGSFSSAGTAALCWDNGGGSFINDCSGAPVADYAEIYPTHSSVDYGEIVVTSDQSTTIDRIETDREGNTLAGIPQNISLLERSSEPYQNSIIGITSRNWSDFSSTGHNVVNENDHPLPISLSGRVPVKISPSSSPVKAGDFITTSNDPGKAMKATQSGYAIGKALEDWSPNSGQETILVFVNLGYHDPNLALTDSGDLNISQDNSGNYVVEKTASTFVKTTVDKIGAFAKLVAANIKAGYIQTKELIADTITVNNKILAPTVETEKLVTNFISPLTADGIITIQGNASVSGDLIADRVITNELIADKVKASTIEGLRQKIEDIVANLNLTSEVKEVPTSEVAIDVNTLNAIYQLLESRPATNSAEYADVSFIEAEGAFFSDYLAVLGTATITDLRVTNSITLAKITGLNGSVDLAGNLNISGDLTVAGNVNILGSLAAPTASFSSLLAQTLTAEKAEIDELTTSQLIIAADNSTSEVGTSFTSEVSTPSASIATNATAGKAVLPAGLTEYTIYTPRVDASSLIYVTPTGDPQNQVLYVKSKQTCPEKMEGSDLSCSAWFKVAINQALPVDLEFNWWIIKLE